MMTTKVEQEPKDTSTVNTGLAAKIDEQPKKSGTLYTGVPAKDDQKPKEESGTSNTALPVKDDLKPKVSGTLNTGVPGKDEQKPNESATLNTPLGVKDNEKPKESATPNTALPVKDDLKPKESGTSNSGLGVKDDQKPKESGTSNTALPVKDDLKPKVSGTLNTGVPGKDDQKIKESGTSNSGLAVKDDEKPKESGTSNTGLAAKDDQKPKESGTSNAGLAAKDNPKPKESGTSKSGLAVKDKTSKESSTSNRGSSGNVDQKPKESSTTPSAEDTRDWDFACFQDVSGKLAYKRPFGRLGEINVNDFHELDRNNLRHLAKQEFERVAKKHNISSKTRKSNPTEHTENDKVFFGNKSVFGVNPHNLYERDHHNPPVESKTCLVFDMLIDAWAKKIDQPMLPRVPGPEVDVIKKLMADDIYTNRASIREKLLKGPAYDILAILEFFFREIPDSVFTAECVDNMFQCYGIKDATDQIKAMKMLLLQLPSVNLAMIEILFMLAHWSVKTTSSQMSVQEFVRRMGPAMFGCATGEAAQKSLSTSVSVLVYKYYPVLYAVPPFMVRAIRTHVQNSKELKEYVDKFGEVNLKKGLIPVTAPEQGPTACVEVNFTHETTADEVIRKLMETGHKKILSSRDARPKERPKNQSFNDCEMDLEDVAEFTKHHHLDEVGGNLHRRKLHSGSNVLAAVQANPNAQWVMTCYH